MSKIINVRGNVEINDPFYRYKMEEIKVRDENKGTVLVNIENICKSLNRTSDQLIKYLQKQMGISFIKKNGTIHTSKKVNQNEIQKHIFNYIQHYVLCEKCNNPETEWLNEKTAKNNIFIKCHACSHLTEIKL